MDREPAVDCEGCGGEVVGGVGAWGIVQAGLEGSSGWGVRVSRGCGLG